MSQLVIISTFPDIENMDSVMEDIKNAVNSIDNDNIDSNYILLTKAEKTDLQSGVSSDTYLDKSSATLQAGMPVYFVSVNGVTLADGSNTSKFCMGFCIKTNGSKATIRTSGPVANAHIELGLTVTFGQELWLSSETGHVTNVRPQTNVIQSLGFATGNGTIAGGKVDIVALIRAPEETLDDL